MSVILNGREHVGKSVCIQMQLFHTETQLGPRVWVWNSVNTYFLTLELLFWTGSLIAALIKGQRKVQWYFPQLSYGQVLNIKDA